MSKTELHIVYGGIIAVILYWAYSSLKSSATTSAYQGANDAVTNSPGVQALNSAYNSVKQNYNETVDGAADESDAGYAQY